MRKLLIAAPWVTASGAAFYAVSQWGRLPARMAVTFFMGHTTGWQTKEHFITVMLLLLFGLMALLTVMLSRPDKIRIRGGPLNDPVEGRRRMEQFLLLAHVLLCGLLLPFSLVHVISRNL